MLHGYGMVGHISLSHQVLITVRERILGELVAYWVDYYYFTLTFRTGFCINCAGLAGA